MLKKCILLFLCIAHISMQGSALSRAWQQLTERDKKVLAEEAVPLDKLMQKYGLQHKVEHLYPHKTSIIFSQNNAIVGRVDYNNHSSPQGYEPCYIAILWVAPAFRGKDLGTTLLNLAIKDLETTGGCHKIYLWAHPFDLRIGEDFEFMLGKVKKYYKRFGFEEYSKKRDYMRYVSQKQPMPSKNQPNQDVIIKHVDVVEPTYSCKHPRSMGATPHVEPKG